VFLTAFDLASTGFHNLIGSLEEVFIWPLFIDMEIMEIFATSFYMFGV